MSDTNNSNINYASRLATAIRQENVDRCIELANLVDINLALNNGDFSTFLMQQYFAHFGGITPEIIRNFRILLGEIVRYADGRMSAGVQQGIVDINNNQSFQLTAATRLYHNGIITREEAELMGRLVIAPDSINADIKYKALQAMLDNGSLTYNEATVAAYATVSDLSIRQSIFNHKNQDLMKYNFHKIMLNPNALYNNLIEAVNKDHHKQINKDKAYIFFNVLMEKYRERLEEARQRGDNLENDGVLLSILAVATGDTVEVVGNKVANKWVIKGSLNELIKNVEKFQNVKNRANIYAKKIQESNKQKIDTRAALVNMTNQNNKSATYAFNKGVNSNNNNSIANPNNSNYPVEKKIDFKSVVALNNYDKKLSEDAKSKNFWLKNFFDFMHRIFCFFVLSNLFNSIRNKYTLNQNTIYPIDKRGDYSNLSKYQNNNYSKATDDFNSTSIPLGIKPC